MLSFHRDVETVQDETERYAPIADYGLIGDCRAAALVSRSGSVDWLCLPGFASKSVFAAILDARRGGHCSLRPAGEFSVSRRYVGNSPVLETVFSAAHGRLRIRDAMPVHAGKHAQGLHPQRELLRSVEVLDGEVVLEVEFEPRLDFARIATRFEPMSACGWRWSSGRELFLLRCDVALEPVDEGASLHGRVRLTAGERRALSLSYTSGDIGTLPLLGDEVDLRLDDTCAWWEAWSDLCCYDGPYRASIVRSAITLKLLDYALSGAVVAAPTASLPENIGGSRNWDYRFCWLRDAAFTFRSLRKR